MVCIPPRDRSGVLASRVTPVSHFHLRESVVPSDRMHGRAEVRPEKKATLVASPSRGLFAAAFNNRNNMIVALRKQRGDSLNLIGGTQCKPPCRASNAVFNCTLKGAYKTALYFLVGGFNGGT